MDWKQKRINDIEERLLFRYKLLDKYEKESDYERDPATKERLEDAIQELKKKIEESKQELEGFTKSQSIKGDSSSPEALHEDINEPLLEEEKTFEATISSPDILPEHIYNELSAEEKAVVEDLKERLKNATGETFTFLLIGRTGVGKSSTLNSLMGAKIAPVSDFDPCTTNIDIQETNLHGAIVRVIDTPGLCDIEGAANDAQYIELMRQKIPYTIDVVLFVSRLNESRVDASEQRGLRLITEAFGELFWKKAVIVFTCSDMVSPSRFEEYLDERTKRIHAALLKLQLNHDTIHTIPSIAVDNTDLEKVNPDGQTWIQQLYLTVFNRADDSSKYVFVLSTSHMLEKIGVTPIGLWDKVNIGLAAATSGVVTFNAVAALGGSAAGLFLISNPVGWAILLGSAAVTGSVVYKSIKK
jgi:GTP-binding protein EngB required for normal cell division